MLLSNDAGTFWESASSLTQTISHPMEAKSKNLPRNALNPARPQCLQSWALLHYQEGRLTRKRRVEGTTGKCAGPLGMQPCAARCTYYLGRGLLGEWCCRSAWPACLQGPSGKPPSMRDAELAAVSLPVLSGRGSGPLG